MTDQITRRTTYCSELRKVPLNGSEGTPLFFFPGWRDLRGTIILSLLFFLLFYSVAGTTAYVTDLHNWRLTLYAEFELAIPFWASWSIVYLSINLMLLLALFIFPRWQQLLPLFVTLVFELFVAAFFFLVLPLKDGFSQPDAAGSFENFFLLADILNLSNNYLPSLHVTFAWTLALAYSSGRSMIVQSIFIGWAIAISLSTILIHQHHLVDIFAGIVLAYAAMHWVYPRIGQDEVLGIIETRVIRWKRKLSRKF